MIFLVVGIVWVVGVLPAFVLDLRSSAKSARVAVEKFHRKVTPYLLMRYIDYTAIVFGAVFWPLSLLARVGYSCVEKLTVFLARPPRKERLRREQIQLEKKLEQLERELLNV